MRRDGRRCHRWLLPAILAALLLYAPAAAPAEVQDVITEVAFPQLRFNKPLFLTSAPGQDRRLYVLEQDGRLLWIDNDPAAGQTHVALDIRTKVRSGGEEGLLGLAFHRDFAKNRQLFLHYSALGRRRNVLARYTMNAAGDAVEPTSEEVLLEVAQPYANHNGGMLAFGPDGFLYIALGDGGSGGDPQGNGQNLATLLGSILRIDVDRRDPGKAYAIPQDNPFVGRQGAAGEIFAYGLRNPWRFSFDRQLGTLWAGDVGQNAWEEIDIIEKGGNYGWNWWEGSHRYRKGDLPGDTMIMPVIEYSHKEGRSVTGGYVYRGKAVPQLAGWYLYGDYVSGVVWALRYDLEGKKLQENQRLSMAPLITSFGEDAAGELYITSYDGRIYRFRSVRPN